jgi:putative cardiolipin synthase
VLIGSMNLDQRSAKLNTEMAVLLDNPELAEQLRRQFALTISPELSYRVTLAENGDLLWYDRSKGRDRLTTHEPDTTVLFRVGVSLLRVLPIEPLL